MAASALISADEAQAWLGAANPVDADTLALVVDAANQAVIDTLLWDPSSQDYAETYDGLGGAALVLRQAPVTAVASVMLTPPGGPAVPLDPSAYVFDDNQVIWLQGRFARGPRNVRVAYTAGWDPLPSTIKQACFYVLKAMLVTPGLDANATGESYAGVSSASWQPQGPGAVPNQARALLARYMRVV